MSLSQPQIRLVPETIDQLLAQLSIFGQPHRRSMFGGYGLYLDGTIFSIIADQDIYLKVGDKNQADFKKIGSQPFVYEGKTKPVVMSYWLLPPAIWSDPTQWQQWVAKSWLVSKEQSVKKNKQQRLRKIKT